MCEIEAYSINSKFVIGWWNYIRSNCDLYCIDWLKATTWDLKPLKGIYSSIAICMLWNIIFTTIELNIFLKWKNCIRLFPKELIFLSALWKEEKIINFIYLDYFLTNLLYVSTNVFMFFFFLIYWNSLKNFFL